MIGTCLCTKLFRFSNLSSRLVGQRRVLPILKVLVCFQSRYPIAAVYDSRDLPWIQYSKDVFQRDPIRHRLIGYSLFRRLLKQVGVPFINWKDFSFGAAAAVKTIAQCISQHDTNDELQHYLGPALLRQYKIAFEQLKFENKKIELKVEEPRGMHISGARFIIGNVEPGDEYVMNFIGQKIIVSKSDIEQLDTTRSFDALKSGRKLGEEAFTKGIRFQLDVKFMLNERYSLWEIDDDEYYSEYIDRTPINVYHRWRFESLIPHYTEEFQLDWMVVDVDDFLKTKFLLPEETKNGW